MDCENKCGQKEWQKIIKTNPSVLEKPDDMNVFMSNILKLLNVP